MTMVTFWLLAEAPHGAFKSLQGGSFRSTLPIMPPTAAWGLVLNLARIDSNRQVQAKKAVRPNGDIAVGVRYHPTVSTLLTQTHSYPVGNVGKEMAASTHGQKYWISPVSREILVDLSMVIGVRTTPQIAGLVHKALDGTLEGPRHNVPFAGESTFTFQTIRLVEAPPPTIWYVAVKHGDHPTPGTCSLPVQLDFTDSARGVYRLFAPTRDPVEGPPPDGAWALSISPS